MLVADQDYWEANKLSNAAGNWPSSVPSVTKGSTAAHTLDVFNDTFADTAVTVTWEVHTDSATGAQASNGSAMLDVPLGSMRTTSINVTAPSSGSKFYLVLRATKGGATVFEETSEDFNLN